jgi:putative transposase
MVLSDAGKIVSDCWFDLPNHYNNIILDEFVILPNHIHGIIRIQNPNIRNPKHGLSEFVRAFKSFSSRRINEIQKTNKSGIWQSRFYDRIIWSEKDLNRIRLYIKNNIINWLNNSNFTN